jgi:hypothetical protein
LTLSDARLKSFSVAYGWLALFAVAAALAADDIEAKRHLEHTDYAKWNKLGSFNISDDGRWVSYSIQPGEGDATLMLREVASDREYSVVRGTGLRFTHDSQFALFTVEPDPEKVKRLRKEKKPDHEIPKDKLTIVHLESGQETTIESVSRFTLPAESSEWVAFMLLEEETKPLAERTKSELTETYEIRPGRLQLKQEIQAAEGEKKAAAGQQPKASKASGAESEPAGEPEVEKGKAKDKEKKTGRTLVLRNLISHMEQRFPDVINYRFDESGQHLAFATSAERGEDDGVYVVDLGRLQTQPVLTGRGNYGQVVFSQDGRQLAFVTDRDDYESEQAAWSLYLWRKGRSEAQRVVTSDTDGIPDDWEIASTSAPQFTEDERRLSFRTRPRPKPVEEEPEDAESEPVAKLDLWHWQDPYLQPEQLLRAESDKNRSYEAVLDLRSRKVLQLETEKISSVTLDPRSEAEVVVGTAPDQYNKMRSWDLQAYSDWYLINFRTG